MTTKAPKTPSKKYENNPFMLAIHGLNLIFDKAKSVAILFLVLSIVGFISGVIPQPADDSLSKPFNPSEFALPNLLPSQWAMIALVALILITTFIFIGAMLSGISSYTSARLARGHTTTLSEAFHAVLEKFFSYIWLQIIITVKLLLWTLLLIVPGIIMSVRYSLANVAFFDKDLRGNAAIKESLKLTKGAWLTTFASQTLFNMITLGVISELVNSGAKAILYRQFTTSAKKPAAHFLSWLTLALPFLFLILLFVLVFMFVVFASVAGTIFK